MSITKKIQPTKVLYNLAERCVTEIKTKDCIYFDSISEYECFLLLDRLFNSEKWDILIHKKMVCQSLEWKLDFTVKPKSQNIAQWQQLQRLCEIINGCEIDVPPTQIYIEYKGVQDQNFSIKMRNLISYHPDLAKTIILCSRYDSAFGFWNEKNNHPSTHFISSCYTLEKQVKKIILA